MLQIRLSKGGSGGDGGGSSAKSAAAVETVTVACPDHLVLADLPVAKSLGVVTTAAVRSVGRRSRRHLGERVHFCVRCDFPIAIYGRLMPCEHAFCLACARTDSSCFLCDERIQKIQTIKIMEGIFICAAPHCLKTFLKRAEFEAHIHETHMDILNPNAEREGGNDNPGNVRPSSIETQKQSLMPEMSTAHAPPPKSGFSPSSNSQHQDREDRNHHHQLRDLRDPSPRPPLQPKPPPFPQSQNPNPPYQQNPNSEQFPSDKSTGGIPPETSFSNFQAVPNQPLNYAVPFNANQAAVVSAPMFTYAPFTSDGSQPYFNIPAEMPKPDSTAENISEPGSVLGIPPVAPTPGASFPDNFPRPLGMGMTGMSFQPLQRLPEGFGNPTDPQGVAFFQGDFGNSFPMNPPLPGKESEQQGVLASGPITLPTTMPLPPPPPLPPPLSQQQQQQQQLHRGRDVPPGFGPPGFGQ